MGRKRVIGGVAAAGVAVSLVWFATRSSPIDLLDELVAELRARGEPVTLAEMERPMPPEGQNGATDLEDAPYIWLVADVGEDWRAQVAGPWNSTIVAPWESNATPEQLEATRRFVASLGAVYACIDAGAEKPEIAWRLDPDDLLDPMDGGSGDMQTLYGGRDLLEARAALAATPAERLRAIRSCLALGARFRARRSTQHAGCAGLFVDGCLTLRAGLERARVDPIAARGALDALLATDWGARLATLARGERAFILERFPSWLDGSIESALWGSPHAPELDFVLHPLMTALDFHANELMSSPRAAIDYLRGMDRYLVPGASAREFCLLGDRTWQEHDPIERIFLFLCRRLTRADANARLARTALAAYAYRAEHGAWPSSAADLSPLLPDGAGIDPFTGKPFEMVLDGDVLVLRALPWECMAESEEEAVFNGYVWRLPPR